MWRRSSTSYTSNRSEYAQQFTLNSGMLIVALLAMLTLHLFRLRGMKWPALEWGELSAFIAVPLVVFFFLKRRLPNLSPKTLSPQSVYGFQLGALLVGGLMVAWQIVTRSFGAGDPNEIVVLLVIQSIAWYLAIFSVVPGFEKASAALNGSIVFFVGCMAEQIAVFVLAGLFAVAVLWWLLGRYWNRLEHKTIDGRSQLMRVNGSAIGGTTLLLTVVGCLVAMLPITNSGIMVAGFMPFSGGENGMQDELARSGVGDGNMLAAGINATTTGAVDSDTFIEGHRPSMYDVNSERYEGPIAKKRPARTISLAGLAKHLDDAKQSEQSGRSFRTMREASKPTDLKLENRITRALFFVEGTVPARFVNNTFHHFDGWDWSNQPPVEASKKMPTILLENNLGTSIFRLAQTVSDYLTGRRLHRVKVMRLETSTLPAPSLLSGWHIDHAKQVDLFRWNEAWLVRMNGDSIAPHAVIDVESFVPNYHVLRSNLGLIPSNDSDSDPQQASAKSLFLQLPGNATDETVNRLATEWTARVTPGWEQVEAIVNRMRSDYELDPNWQRDDQVDDTVGHFFEHNGGPSYMFATTCALTLRSAGYPTRLTSGFLVQKADYQSKTRQSIVTSENLHMWPEVCLDGKFWIPVEPTPGYPIPYSDQTAWQWVTAQVFTAWNWIWNHPATSVLCVAGLAACVLLRAEIITLLMLAWWYVVKCFWPQGLLKATRQLIDLRFRVAGDRRPESATIGSWYRRVDPALSAQFFDQWNASNFSDVPRSVPRSTLVSTCSEPLIALTLKRIREFVSTTKKVNSL